MEQQQQQQQQRAPAFRRGLDGRILCEIGGSDWKPVTIRLCFPWSHPQRFLSVRDVEEQELVLLESPASLDRESRAVVEEAMAEAGFVLEITKLESVAEEFELRQWKVQTKQGPRTFQTKLEHWPRQMPNGSVLIRDVAGDLHHIPDPDALDEQSRRLLWAFVD